MLTQKGLKLTPEGTLGSLTNMQTTWSYQMLEKEGIESAIANGEDPFKGDAEANPDKMKMADKARAHQDGIDKLPETHPRRIAREKRNALRQTAMREKQRQQNRARSGGSHPPPPNRSPANKRR